MTFMSEIADKQHKNLEYEKLTLCGSKYFRMPGQLKYKLELVRIV